MSKLDELGGLEAARNSIRRVHWYMGGDRSVMEALIERVEELESEQDRMFAQYERFRYIDGQTLQVTVENAIHSAELERDYFKNELREVRKRVGELEREKAKANSFLANDKAIMDDQQAKLQSYRKLADCVLEATIWTSGTRVYLGNARWADIERLARELREMDKGVR